MNDRLDQARMKKLEASWLAQASRGHDNDDALRGAIFPRPFEPVGACRLPRRREERPPG